METPVFQSNRSQAVVFPDDVKRVEVTAVGRIHIVTPAAESRDSWFDGESVRADFMSDRDQPQSQDRESL